MPKEGASSTGKPDPRAWIERIPCLRSRSVRVSPLEGGLTNYNYRIDTDDGTYVLRLPGEETSLLGIDRDAEHACARIAASLDVGPGVVAWLPKEQVMLRRFVSGRILAAEDIRSPEGLRRVAATLRRYHDHRPAAVGVTFSPFDTIRSYRELVAEREVSVPDRLEEALNEVFRVEKELGPPTEPCLCHNDLLAANLIDDGVRVCIIDWEYGGVGDPYFDLANLCANNGFEAEHEAALLAAYAGRDRTSDLLRLRRLRAVSDVREAMWGFVQAGISSLEIDYREYGLQHLERYFRAARLSG